MKHTTLFLREKDKQQLLKLFADYLPTVTVWAYGSRVNGDAHDTSDLDLVLRSADLNKIPVLELENFLEALTNSNIPILVDARDWARLPTSFHEEILKSYVVLNDECVVKN
jgi:predicted nucleotidyltransferase